jgi:hypothetical protein
MRNLVPIAVLVSSSARAGQTMLDPSCRVHIVTLSVVCFLDRASIDVVVFQRRMD